MDESDREKSFLNFFVRKNSNVAENVLMSIQSKLKTQQQVMSVFPVKIIGISL